MDKLSTLIQLGRETVDDWHNDATSTVGDAMAGYLHAITEALSQEQLYFVMLTSPEGGASFEMFASLPDAAQHARSWAESVGVLDGPNDDGDTVGVFKIALSTMTIEGVPVDALPDAG